MLNNIKYIYLYDSNKFNINDIIVYYKKNIINYDEIYGKNVNYKNELLNKNNNDYSNQKNYVLLEFPMDTKVDKIIIDMNKEELSKFKGYLEIYDDNNNIIYIHQINDIKKDDNYYVIKPYNIYLKKITESEENIESYTNFDDIYNELGDMIKDDDDFESLYDDYSKNRDSILTKNKMLESYKMSNYYKTKIIWTYISIILIIFILLVCIYIFFKRNNK